MTKQLETYPGYPVRFVNEDDLTDLEMIICNICGYVVSEDEHLACPTCDVNMCLYCHEADFCPEHGQEQQ
jgi:hypothetical protein